MVLNRVIFLALLVCGCGKSLFDNGPGGGDDGPPADGSNGSGDAPIVPSTCPAPCLGDVGGDFDGSPTGVGGHWRYLDDGRRHTWTPMTGTTTKTGMGENKIAACADNPTEPGCVALPGALLFSSTGANGATDPSVELTIVNPKVVQLSLRVHVPTGGKAQTVRLYRSAREDSLYTATAEPGVTLETALVVDAFAGERLLFALAPTAGGTPNVAVQLFASDTEEVFPKFCQLGLDFEAASAIGTSLANKCAGTPLTSWNDAVDPEVMIAPLLTATGPFPEMGMAGDFIEGRHFDSNVAVDRAADNTTQFWFKLDQFGVQATILVSDMDLDDIGPGGIVIDLFENSGARIEVGTCTQGMVPVQYNLVDGSFPDAMSWHFFRVVQHGGTVDVCIDGSRLFQVPIPAGTSGSSYPIRVGRNSVWNPQAAYVDGKMDDLRIFKAALPCE